VAVTDAARAAGPFLGGRVHREAKEGRLSQPRRRLRPGALLCAGGLAIAACVCPPSLAWATGRYVVQAVSVASVDGHARLVFALSGPARHSLFALARPERLVIDLPDTRLGALLPPGDLTGTPLRGLRSGWRNGSDLRIVLDLSRAVLPWTSLVPGPRAGGYELVVDLLERNSQVVASASPTPSNAPPTRLRDVVVVIDPGHGGKDPGAIGPRGTQEKDVVLSIARRLAAMVQAQRGMRAVLTRQKDVYLPLRTRIRKARQYRADLFVSIHADADPQNGASGASVFVLSERGASSEAARWLAERENAADLIGGVSLDDKEPMLASVLLDLSQTAAIEASTEAASRFLASLHAMGALHKAEVQYAGFVVLKSPDIPSVLIETAFLTNPHEELKLRDARYQAHLAAAIANGIRAYFAKRAPAGTWLASRQHVITPGETLGTIAKQYNISVDRLRLANGLATDRVHVGEVLHIPSSEDG
jgi:N-acetylmuramoyl-L-alanine amidase